MAAITICRVTERCQGAGSRVRTRAGPGPVAEGNVRDGASLLPSILTGSLPGPDGSGRATRLSRGPLWQDSGIKKKKEMRLLCQRRHSFLEAGGEGSRSTGTERGGCEGESERRQVGQEGSGDLPVRLPGTGCVSAVVFVPAWRRRRP